MELTSTIDSGKIFEDENHFCRIDFSSALWAETDLTKIYGDAKLTNLLKSVDSIAETSGESMPFTKLTKAVAENQSVLMLMEYKNFDKDPVKRAKLRNGEESDKILTDVAKKYFDSLSFAIAKQQQANSLKIYVWIMVAKDGDKTLRERIRERLAKKLPFLLQKQQNLPISLIDSLYVVDIEEWQRLFPSFSVSVSQQCNGEFVPLTDKITSRAEA